MNKTPLFVYGSMKNGFRNDWRLKGSRFVGTVVTADPFFMYPAWHYNFPYMTERGGDLHIRGELYLVDKETLALIDGFEGVSTGHYKRAAIIVIDEKGRRVEVYAYLMGPANSLDECDVNFPISEWTKEHQAAGEKREAYCKSKK